MAAPQEIKPSEFLHASIFGVEDFKGEIAGYPLAIQNRIRLALRRIGRQTRSRLLENIKATFKRDTGTLEGGTRTKYREDEDGVMRVQVSLHPDAFYGFILEGGGGKDYAAPAKGDKGSKLWEAVFGHLRAKARRRSGQVKNRNPNWSMKPHPFALPAFEYGQSLFADEMNRVSKERVTASEARRFGGTK